MTKKLDTYDSQKIITAAFFLAMALIALFTVIIVGCHFIGLDIPEDSPPEELLEEIIKERYDIDLDLSPLSPEPIA